MPLTDWEKIYIAFTKLIETIWDWMYSWEEVKRHIQRQADNIKEIFDINEII